MLWVWSFFSMEIWIACYFGHPTRALQDYINWLTEGQTCNQICNNYYVVVGVIIFLNGNLICILLWGSYKGSGQLHQLIADRWFELVSFNHNHGFTIAISNKFLKKKQQMISASVSQLFKFSPSFFKVWMKRKTPLFLLLWLTKMNDSIQVIAIHEKSRDDLINCSGFGIGLEVEFLYSRSVDYQLIGLSQCSCKLLARE